MAKEELVTLDPLVGCPFREPPRRCSLFKASQTMGQALLGSTCIGRPLVGRRHKLKHEMCINVTFWVKGEAALGLKIG